MAASLDFSFLKGLGGSAGSLLTSVLWGIGIISALAIIGYYVFKWWKNLTFYSTPVTLTRILENGTEKNILGLKGGEFWNNGIRDFKIKIPKQRAPHILGYIPDKSKADADGRLHFITLGDGTIWQQYEKIWQVEEIKKGIGENGEEIEYKYTLINKPIPRETKQLTINAIKNWRETIDKSKLTAFSIAIGAFIVMVIAHLVSLYVQTRIKCGTP